MAHATNGPVSLYYETQGDPGDPALLLVMGLGAQLTAWPDAMCRSLADHGLFVVRLDNRDVGLSSKSDGTPPDVMAIVGASLGGGALPETPYKLSDMAADAVAVLDALGIGRAHIVGASMGGMIVQTMAINHPTRVRTLTSIMSTTGAPDVGQATPAAMGALLTAPPTTRDEAIEAGAKTWKIISGPLFDESEARKRTAESFDRCFNPAGAAFQLAAILTSGDRTAALAEVSVPTLVIHGRADPLVTLSGGQATAKAIPGARLLVLDDMGHDLPTALLPEIVDAIVGLTKES